jgi:hypothetical protein
MLLPESLSSQVICGSEDPQIGWSSRRFDQRVASPTLVGAATIRGTSRFVTRMQLRSRQHRMRADTAAAPALRCSDSR